MKALLSLIILAMCIDWIPESIHWPLLILILSYSTITLANTIDKMAHAGYQNQDQF